MSASDDRVRLTVVGDLVEDVVIWPAGAVRAGTDNPAAVHRGRGGSGANVAAAAAALGVPVRFIGRVGDDATGRGLARGLSAQGVDVRVQRAGFTGTVVVIVDPAGERTMYPDRGAAAQLGPIDEAWLATTGVLHVPAYGLLGDGTSRAAIISAAAFVRQIGGGVTVDVSAVSVVDAIGVEAFRDLLGLLRPAVVFANSEEAAALDVEALTAAHRPVLVVKHGALPAVVVQPDGTSLEVPADHVDGVIDTTGAGDAFAAGFLSEWSGGAEIHLACRAGHRCAAAVLGVAGAGHQQRESVAVQR